MILDTISCTSPVKDENLDFCIRGNSTSDNELILHFVSQSIVSEIHITRTFLIDLKFTIRKALIETAPKIDMTEMDKMFGRYEPPNVDNIIYVVYSGVLDLEPDDKVEYDIDAVFESREDAYEYKNLMDDKWERIAKDSEFRRRYFVVVGVEKGETLLEKLKNEPR